MNRGVFIAIDGIDGSGKTTICNVLRSRFLLARRRVRFIVQPDPKCAGYAQIRSLLEGKTPFSPLEQALLFGINRVDQWRFVESSIQSGRDVISDRSSLSTLVYNGDDPRVVELVFSMSKYDPDLIVFVDSDPAVCKARIAQRGENLAIFEENLAEKREKYLYFIDILKKNGRSVEILHADSDLETHVDETVRLIESFKYRGV